MREILRVVEQRRRSLAQARVAHIPDPVASAGRSAEIAAGDQISRAIEGTGWAVHAALRVVDPATPDQRRSELDFVITSLDAAILIELKNWSGHVLFEAGELIQARRTRPDGDRPASINHGAVLAQLAAKQGVLRRFHEAQRHQASPPMRSLLVFWHPRVTLDCALADRPEVVFGQALAQHLPARRQGESNLYQALLALLRHLGMPVGTPKVRPEPSAQIRAFRNSLDECGTWDLLALHGGKTIAGDFLRLESADGLDFDRAAYSHARVRADRHPLMAFVRDPTVLVELLQRNGRKASMTPGTATTVLFHSAGQPTPDRFLLSQCTALTFGYSTRRPVGKRRRASGR